MMEKHMAVPKIPLDTKINNQDLETFNNLEITKVEIPQIEVAITDTSKGEVVIDNNMIDLIEIKMMIKDLLPLTMDLLVINHNSTISYQVLSNRSYSSDRP